MTRISTDVGYLINYGWCAWITVIDDTGGKETYRHFCATRWGAHRYAKRWKRKLERLDQRGGIR